MLTVLACMMALVSIHAPAQGATNGAAAYISAK